MIERYIEIENEKYFKSDIEIMSKEQIKMLCSFLYKESDLLFVQKHANENFSYIVDNLIFKL